MKQREAARIALVVCVLCHVVRLTTGTACAEPQWRVMAGVTARPISFQFQPQPFEHWDGLVEVYEDLGTLGIVSGKNSYNTPIEYEDGEAYVVYSGGTAKFSGGSELSGNPYDTVIFHVRQYSPPQAVVPLPASSDAIGLGPYVMVARQLSRSDQKGVLELIGRYSVVKGRCSDGWTTRQQIVQDEATYEILYEMLPRIYIGDGHWSSHVLIYDPDAFARDYIIQLEEPDRRRPPRDPEVSLVEMRQVEVDGLVAYGNPSLRLYLHEVTIGLAYFRPLWRGLSMSIMCGPTLNIVDWDYSEDIQWSLESSQEPLVSYSGHGDGIEYIVGGLAELGLEFRNDPDSRFFMHMSVSYHYLSDISVSTQISEVKADATSFSGSVGFGIAL